MATRRAINPLLLDQIRKTGKTIGYLKISEKRILRVSLQQKCARYYVSFMLYGGGAAAVARRGATAFTIDWQRWKAFNRLMREAGKGIAEFKQDIDIEREWNKI